MANYSDSVRHRYTTLSMEDLMKLLAEGGLTGEARGYLFEEIKKRRSQETALDYGTSISDTTEICLHCGSRDFDLDKFWNEYSCKECGHIIKQDSVTATTQPEDTPEYVRYSIPTRVFGVVLAATTAFAFLGMVARQMLMYLNSPRTGADLGALVGALLGGWIGSKVFVIPAVRLVKGNRLADLIRDLKSSKKDVRIKAAVRLRRASPHVNGWTVPALLDALSDQEPRMIRETMKTLTGIAGESVGETSDAWRRWWQERTNQPVV